MMRTSIVTAVVAAILLSSIGPAAAKQRRLQVAAKGAKLHAMMRLLTHLSRDNVVVSGEVSGELTLVEKGLTRSEALRACAARAGGKVHRVGTFHVVLPAASAAKTLKLYRRHLRKRRRWPGRGRRVDLDFQRADLRNLLRLIGAVSGLKIQGTAAVQGKLSVLARNTPWNRLLDLMLLSRGLGARPGKAGRAAVGSLAELTAGKPLELGPIKPPPAPSEAKLEQPPQGRRVLGWRHPAASLRLVAIVSGAGVRPRALLQAPSGPGLILKRGDYLAKEQLKVVAVAADGIKLERTTPGRAAHEMLVGLGAQIK